MPDPGDDGDDAAPCPEAEDADDDDDDVNKLRARFRSASYDSCPLRLLKRPVKNVSFSRREEDEDVVVGALDAQSSFASFSFLRTRDSSSSFDKPNQERPNVLRSRNDGNDKRDISSDLRLNRVFFSSLCRLDDAETAKALSSSFVVLRPTSSKRPRPEADLIMSGASDGCLRGGGGGGIN